MIHLTELDLISFLNLVTKQDYDKIATIQTSHPQILTILEALGVITVKGSDDSKDKFTILLTNLGQSITTNIELKNSISQQGSVLQTIASDIQRIKSSLSAISLDVIRSQGLMQDESYGSNHLLEKNTDLREVPTARQEGSKLPNEATGTDLEGLKNYIRETKENLPRETIQAHQRNLKRIKDNYKKISSIMQNKAYEEFGIEAFLLVDALFLFILSFFDQKNQAIMSYTLEKKYTLLKEFPILVDPELVQFLDRFYNDIQNNNPEPLKIGEKTALKIFNLINDIYKPFSSIFSELL